MCRKFLAIDKKLEGTEPIALFAKTPLKFVYAPAPYFEHLFQSILLKNSSGDLNGDEPATPSPKVSPTAPETPLLPSILR